TTSLASGHAGGVSVRHVLAAAVRKGGGEAAAAGPADNTSRVTRRVLRCEPRRSVCAPAHAPSRRGSVAWQSEGQVPRAEAEPLGAEALGPHDVALTPVGL